jgi:photosystem II stability/assembly factor-like uncharacterized protein
MRQHIVIGSAALVGLMACSGTVGSTSKAGEVAGSAETNANAGRGTAGTRSSTGGAGATGGSMSSAGSNAGRPSGNGGRSATGGHGNDAGNAGNAGNAGEGGGDSDAGVINDRVVPPNCPANNQPMPTGRTPTLEVGRWTNISPPGLYRPRGDTPPYGVMDVKVDPCNPYMLYALADIQGIWRSSDGGATWKQIGDLPQPTSSGILQISPSNPQVIYYGGGVRGAALGFWISKDGGDHWAQPKGFTDGANNSDNGWTNDVYSVVVDPSNPAHLLLTFHSGFAFKADAGVLESTDSGETWIRHAPMAGWGAGHGITFLGNSSTWLLATQVNGYWRTADAGKTWTQVSTHDSMHGACIGFYSKAGALYVGANNQILKSTDNGLSFKLVGPQSSDGYYQVIGDGEHLFAQAANTGANTNGAQPYFVSKDDDGMTWTAYNDQTFSDGPYRMDLDAANHILYSANFNDGVWAIKLK